MKNIITAAQSGSYVLFDEYIPRSENGRQLLIQLKEHIGKQLVIEPALTQKLESRGRNKDTEAALLFLNDISWDGGAELPVSDKPVIYIGSDLDKLEEWHNASDNRPCTVYLFNKKHELVLWAEERAQNRAKAIDNLSYRLGNGTCWITASALSSPRLKNMVSLLDEEHFSSALKHRIHILDISKEKAGSAAPILIEALEEQCGPAASIGEHIPMASEQEILAMLVRYARPECNVYILVANEADSNAISATYRNMYNEELAPSTFVSISWYGALVPPRWIAAKQAKQQAEVDLSPSAFQASSAPTPHTLDFPVWSTPCTVTELAEVLCTKPFKLIAQLLPLGIFANPTYTLQPAQVCKLWDMHIPGNITAADLANRLLISQDSMIRLLHSLGIHANPTTILDENQTRMVGEKLLHSARLNTSFADTRNATKPKSEAIDLVSARPTPPQAAEEIDYMTKEELTNWLGKTPLRLRLVGANTRLSTELVRQLCKNLTPEEPSSDYVFKVGGPKWGQMLKAGISSEAIRSSLENPHDREMCIAYSRRWNRPDVASYLLKLGYPLSLYCIRNWIKNGQNAKEKRTLMETILNDAMYDNLKEIISSTPGIQQANDVIHMLSVLEQATNIQTCATRARKLISMIERN